MPVRIPMATVSDTLKTVFFVLLLLQFAPPLLQNIKQQYTKLLEPRSQVGYLAIKGLLYDSAYYTKYLKKFFENQDIKAIVLKIECPGGASGTAEVISHEIDVLKREHPKPIIAYSENICASGGYYIAAATDFIIAAPSTLIGSIGTSIPAQFQLKEFIEQFKIHYELIKSGNYKATTDPFVDLTPEQKALLQGLANDSHQTFIEYVKKHRHALAGSDTKEWAEAQLFTGRQAVQKKLIDQLGSKSDAVKKVKELGIIDGKIEWVKPEQEGGLFGMLFGSSREATSIHGLLNGLLARFGLIC